MYKRQTLIKIATPTNDYENKKDIIYFGSKKPISNDLVVTGNKINWLDAKLTGELISSKNIGSRPLYGTYATDNNADFKPVSYTHLLLRHRFLHGK